jgi:hypothetical protein
MPRELQIPWRGSLPNPHTPESVAAAREIVQRGGAFQELSDEALSSRRDALRAVLDPIEGEMFRRGLIFASDL